MCACNMNDLLCEDQVHFMIEGSVVDTINFCIFEVGYLMLKESFYYLSNHWNHIEVLKSLQILNT